MTGSVKWFLGCGVPEIDEDGNVYLYFSKDELKGFKEIYEAE